jgi:DNA-binding transcriptional MerR regulator
MEKPMSNPVGWITVAETIAALKVLEPKQSVSVDQLHYWDRVGVVPVKRAKQGRAPLYSTQDLALCRVIARLLAAQGIPQHITAALRYLRKPICDAFREKRSESKARGESKALYLDVRGVGHVVDASKVPSDVTCRVDLRDCWRGVSNEMRKQRQRRRTEVWDGRRYLAVEELTAA